MPELPEVEALRVFLDDHLVGKEIARVLPLAISVLKTYDPPLSALEGTTVTSVARHGKFLDIEAGGLHLCTHLARAGWLRWKDSFPPPPPRP
ncbi:Fpg/Nei family DNA glycosylase, partial [Streptomyces griseus]|uniref:DNA-formamidopyrimidine glycosylase family protein n=1 Tax=Streptomyces griseus TaxID=1911 RepID=UPI0027DDE8E5